MRNRALHDALREFALEAAALLVEDQREGAEVGFDVEDSSGKRGPALYNYRPLTGPFLAARWDRLRELPACRPAADLLGAGAATWLSVNGFGGAQAEPALQAMLERLYEEATDFGFPEERFERTYREVEHTLYRDTVGCCVIAALPGLGLESEKVDLGDGLWLVGSAPADSPVTGETVCKLERDAPADDPLSPEEAHERFRALLTGLRLFKAGGVTLSPIGWRRADSGRWTPLELGGAGEARGEPWVLPAEQEGDLRDFLETFEASPQAGRVGWALGRFELAVSRRLDAEGLSDYLLALRALLGAPDENGRSSLALRLATLCAEEGDRARVRRRLELALALERYVMGDGYGEELGDWIDSESPSGLVAELEHHTRALLRDVVCGYLDSDLAAVADDILLEAETPQPAPPDPAPPVPEPPEPAATDEIEIHDTREEPRRFEREDQPEGVTPSADWDEYSAPV